MMYIDWLQQHAATWMIDLHVDTQSTWNAGGEKDNTS